MMDVKAINRKLISGETEVIIRELRKIEAMDHVPPMTQKIITELTQRRDVEGVNLAVICLKKCVDYFDCAREILLKKLKSKTWYIRANTAKSLALLGCQDELVIDQLMLLMGDSEGHDFSAEESAVEALGLIGNPAKKSVPLLINMAHDELDSEKWETRLVLLLEALARIDEGSVDFIKLLIRGVQSCQSVGIANALRHLMSFGEKAHGVLPHLAAFVHQERWLDGDFMTEDSDELILLKALYFIGGHQHPLLKQYINNLKSNHYQEGRLIAIKFERTWLNHL